MSDNVPHNIKVDFARRKGNVPYPCFYCFYNVPTNDTVTDAHNIVKEFGYDVEEGYGEIPQVCMAGMRGPTGHGSCKGMFPTELPYEHRRWYPSSLFPFFTREYAMEMITDINCSRYITKQMLVARAHKGYNTREQRIREFIDEGIVDVSYDVDCNECYSLTEFGQRIADLICELMDGYIIIKESGEPMKRRVEPLVFEYIRSHSDCTAKQIYDHFDKEYDFKETVVPLALEELVMDGYVEPTYNDDFTRITYNTTQKGILRWRALYADNQM